MVDRAQKLKAAKDYVAGKISDIIETNFDSAGGALDTPGTFTTLLEAYQAINIAEAYINREERAQDAEDYRQGVLRNVE